MSLRIAQTFYIDKTVVRGAQTVNLDSVDLYFKAKPRATNNKSGIENPGVSLYVMYVESNDLPDLSKIIDTGTARREYNTIVASSDASIKTNFKFSNPVVVQTDKAYAIGIAFDGDEEFELWACTEGQVLVGTNTTTSGASAKNVGKYYELTSSDTWKALSNKDLKFSVYTCAYSANTSANSVTNTYIIPSTQMEYVMFNRYHPNTANWANAHYGEYGFKETPVIYGTITTNTSNTIIKANSGTINFSTLFPTATIGSGSYLTNDPVLPEYRYIVLRNGATQAANVDVVEVKAVVSNTQLLLARLPKFSSNAATFSVTAVARITYQDENSYTGRFFDYTSNSFVSKVNFKSNMLVLDKSNANSTVRFANNTLESIIINSGGTGYSNSDVITVYPQTNANTANASHISYIPSYANATANVVTNGSGTITGISVTNAGYGMTGNVTYTITTSGGTSANLTIGTGSTIRGALSNAMFADCMLLDVPVHTTFPQLQMLSNEHQDNQVVHHFGYHVLPGYEHILLQANTAMKIPLENFLTNIATNLDYNDGRIHVLASHSNEVKMANVSIQTIDGSVVNTKVKSSSIVEVKYQTNNVFTIPTIQTTQIFHQTYVINNDLTGEKKGHGNAAARHISKKITFAENRNAEDLVVYCDVYRPAGTNVTAYAKIHNVTDQDAFDDKDWTQLELRSNNSALVSSLNDQNDIIEYTFGIPASPASVNTIAGDASLTISSANVVGVGTTWSTDLAVNDVIKIYSPLFPDDYMVTVVRTIANNTFLTVDDAVTDTSLVSTTAKIDLIGRPANGANTEIGNPFQAFIYGPNSSVVRYYDEAMGKNDTYNTFAIKLVLTSNNSSIVPKVWNTRAVGVSA
jgi:hypothetical protein